MDNPVAVAHNSLVVKTVNNRLSHPVEGISDGTMTSVLRLTCHSVSCLFIVLRFNFRVRGDEIASKCVWTVFDF